MFSVNAIARTKGPVSSLLTAVRFAGGGGRPGGKPAFNWKEKKLLNLDGASSKKVKLHSSGEMKDFLKALQSARVSIDLNTVKEQSFSLTTAPAKSTQQLYAEARRVIDNTKLFGPKKTFGLLPKNHSVMLYGKNRVQLMLQRREAKKQAQEQLSKSQE